MLLDMDDMSGGEEVESGGVGNMNRRASHVLTYTQMKEQCPVTASTPAPAPKVTVQMVVSLPYTIDTFTKDKQDSFKKGVAAAADTSEDKVMINAITAAAGRRMLLQTGVDVDFSIEVADATAATALAGSDKLSKEKLNTALADEGVDPITAIK